MSEFINLPAEFRGEFFRSNFLLSGKLEAAAADLRAQGAHVVSVDIGGIQGSDDLFHLLAVDLPFVEGFGNNWDALFDVLGEIEEQWPFPVALLLTSFGQLAIDNVALAMQVAIQLSDFKKTMARAGKQLLVLYEE